MIEFHQRRIIEKIIYITIQGVSTFNHKEVFCTWSVTTLYLLVGKLLDFDKYFLNLIDYSDLIRDFFQPWLSKLKLRSRQIKFLLLLKND